MKKHLSFLILILISCIAITYATNNQDKYFQAMEEEMYRNLKGLTLPDLPKIHYMSYLINANKTTTIDSYFGATTNVSKKHNSTASVISRVGSRKNDNSDYGFYSQSYFSLGNSIASIKDALWESSNDAFFSSIEQFSQKDAFLKQHIGKRHELDFLKAKPSQFIQEGNKEEIDKDYLERLLNKLTNHGNNKKHIRSFTGYIYANDNNRYFINSFGSKYLYNKINIYIQIKAQMQTKSGFEIDTQKEYTFASLLDIDEEKISKEIAEFADNVNNFYNSKRGKPYIGPVLLGKNNTANLLTIFVDSATKTKPMLLPEDIDDTVGIFRDRLGLQVISNTKSVIDNPLLKEYNGTKLFGYYEIDDQGVKAEPIILVENNKLKDLPSSLNPAFEWQNKSNGHARFGKYLPRQQLSNVIFEFDKTVQDITLIAELIKKVKELDLEYGYYVEDGLFFQIYPDGSMKQVVGVDYSIIPRELRNISLAGETMHVNNMFFNGTYISLIAPQIILDGVEIMPTQEEAKRQPKLKSP